MADSKRAVARAPTCGRQPQAHLPADIARPAAGHAGKCRKGANGGSRAMKASNGFGGKSMP